MAARALLVVGVLAAACASPTAGPATVGNDEMRVSSPAFTEGGSIPPRFTCDGADVSPPLTIEGIPSEALALALVFDDPDAPAGTWDHWVVFDVPVTPAIQEVAIPEGAGEVGRSGLNSWGRTGYGGPCPPRGSHRYVFAVYAVDTTLGLPDGATSGEVRAALAGHILAEAALSGTYRRR